MPSAVTVNEDGGLGELGREILSHANESTPHTRIELSPELNAICLPSGQKAALATQLSRTSKASLTFVQVQMLHIRIAPFSDPVAKQEPFGRSEKL